jgi:hypothetical protein
VEKARVGLHEERGPESLDLSFRLVAGHDRFHLDQARRDSPRSKVDQNGEAREIRSSNSGK